jgi:putative ATP-dependent endonuclease of OLD family
MNTRGELLFAKAIILFEGETEEQALPIFAEKHFGNYPFELGLNFIGVGGKNKYTPFLSIAKFLNIPWFIFSDADHDTVSEVKAQIKNVFGKENNYNPKLIDLGNGNDFEKYLISEGFSALLIKSINDIEGDNYFPEEYIKKYNDQKGKGDSIRNYTSDSDGGIERALLDCLSGDKTKYPTQIAENITSLKGEDGKSLIPIKIKELFDAINSELKIQENEL